ncbi:MAG: GNAT family N-acetyltransferase [Rhodobacteraceae bacterium]|nr:GNAT family N-acetyltransferase [Paracoccaceae bacterium]
MPNQTDQDEFAIRRAAAADAEKLAAFGAETFTETFGHFYRPEDLAAFLAASQSPAYYRDVLNAEAWRTYLAVTRAGDLAGYVMCGPMSLPYDSARSDAVELKRLYVSRTRQGAGLGSRLIAWALDWAHERRAGEIYLGVFNANTGAQSLYARHGFVKVGEYYFAVGRQRDHEFIMRRSLG